MGDVARGRPWGDGVGWMDGVTTLSTYGYDLAYEYRYTYNMSTSIINSSTQVYIIYIIDLVYIIWYIYVDIILSAPCHGIIIKSTRVYFVPGTY